jgi:hypothetical protein
MFRKHHGFERCNNGDLEDGYEKIAIYTKGRKFCHVARQVPDGRWESKLGTLDDVIHGLEAVEGQLYGAATIFMRRTIAND